MAAVALLGANPASAEDYRLGVQDKLKIRVVEWQTVDGAFREWTAVSGEYTVGSSGNLSIPFVGETPAAGKTTTEISAVISETLQRRFGLGDKPETSVELAAYRPLYVSGDVETPGEYAFSPGLTVIKATSLAGGNRSSFGMRTERDYINAKGNHDALAEHRIRMLVKAARLEAEAKGDTTVAAPDEVASYPGVKAIVADETAIMTARQRKLALQLSALKDLQSLLEKEIVSLEKKKATQERQLELARDELKGIDSLSDKGLVSNTRVLNAERLIAEVESQNLDLETSILQARQEISEAQQDEIELRNTVESDIAIERQQVQATLKETTIKIEMYRNLVAEALQAGTPADISSTDPTTTYEVLRVVDGKTETLTATEDTPVQPGDVIKVKTVLPSAGWLAGQ
ncbi:MAG TPA: polysaccharide biosynthesis/export family protein [Rhizobiaceae bacterium]|nr:polysaccharide biosynthesis/export family protein [Rhizobiaceae bacterium]